MNEDFVTYEIALKLKEKGFREKCLCRYRNYSKTLHINELESEFARKIDYSEFFKCYNSYIDNDVDAPTIPQVLKWLREEKKIHIQILFTCPSNQWEYITVKMANNELRGMCATFTSYEQAAIAGVNYCLDNLI